MKRAAEMQNLRSAFAVSGCHVLANLPIHRRLQGVFDRKRTAFDEEIAIKRRKPGNARECLDKFAVGFGVNIGIRDLHLRGA